MPVPELELKVDVELDGVLIVLLRQLDVMLSTSSTSHRTKAHGGFLHACPNNPIAEIGWDLRVRLL